VILWDAVNGIARGEPLPRDGGMLYCLAYSPDGLTLATGAANGSVILWDVDPRSWERRATRRANRNLSLAEWKKYIGPDRPYHLTSDEFPPGEGVTVADPAAGRTSPASPPGATGGSK
jgi:hypothetical protein